MFRAICLSRLFSRHLIMYLCMSECSNYTGGIAGGSGTSVKKKTSTAPPRLVTTWPPKPTAKSWPARLKTTWPTVAKRTSYVTPGVTRSKHDRHSTHAVSRPAPLPTGRLPSVTTKIPYHRLTSAPVVYAGGPLVHCQVQLANNYQKMLNISGSWKHVYGRDLGSDIAHLCGVDEARISDVSVAENPLTGLTRVVTLITSVDHIMN